MKTGRIVAVFLLLLLAATVARAEDDETSIRLTPDTTKIIHLEQDASSVIVANPDHASIVLDSPRLLVVMPRQPGTTAFTVLNAKGETVLEKNIIVAGTAKPQYVRIRRACGATDSNCVANSYYYCPDGCYEVTPVGGDGGATQAPPVTGGAGSGGGGAGGSPEDAAASLYNGPGPGAPSLPPSEAGGGPQVNPVQIQRTVPGSMVSP